MVTQITSQQVLRDARGGGLGGSIRTEPPRRSGLIGAPRRMLDGINVTESLRGRSGRQQPRDVTVGKWLKKKERGKKWAGAFEDGVYRQQKKETVGKTGHTLSVSRGPPPRRLPFRAVAADGASARLGSFVNTKISLGLWNPTSLALAGRRKKKVAAASGKLALGFPSVPSDRWSTLPGAPATLGTDVKSSTRGI